MSHEIDKTALADRLRQQTQVNDPFMGQTTPAKMEAGSLLWPGVHWSRIVLDRVTEASGRRFEEYRFTAADGTRVDLPVAFMFAPGDAGGSQVRVYSAHELVTDRAAILPTVDSLHPWQSKDDVLHHYFVALNGNRLEELLDLFEQDGYFRHSNGETFLGRARLKEDFVKMMGASGIRIQYCLATDDGTVNAVEAYMPSGRPAVATYERGSPGRIKAVRIYL